MKAAELSCVNRFLAPSQFVRSKFIENGWAGDVIDVLPHFQRVPEPAPPPPGADAPVLYFGRRSAEKGVADLLRAMRYLPASGCRLWEKVRGALTWKIWRAGSN